MSHSMSTEEAIRYLRSQPEHADVVRDNYLGEDVAEAATRFAASPEFAEVRQLLGDRVPGATVLDLGAGTGIGSFAFASWGARKVFALEPSPSEEIGRGALAKIVGSLPIAPLDAVGEAIPLPDASVDLVYGRQVLHHVQNLAAVLKECARVLRPGGALLICREHVAHNQRQLDAFLSRHAVHRLAGGEHAYRLVEYCEAISGSGLQLKVVLGPWDTIINAFPAAKTIQELQALDVSTSLRRRLGLFGIILSRLPGVRAVLNRRRDRLNPGSVYSFLAFKR